MPRNTLRSWPRTLVAIPVYNEERYVCRVLARVMEYADDILVVDDGSTDRTPQLLTKFPVDVIRHGENRGYGRSLRDAFDWAAMRGYDWILTMDCDEQHEPAAIPAFMDRIRADESDIVSGSRYLAQPLPLNGTLAHANEAIAPADRRQINRVITAELNERLRDAWPRATTLTDAFCGFKAYRVPAVVRMSLSEDGYAFPMQFWAQAAAAKLRVEELPVSLIYNDPNRTFGGTLDDPAVRLAHYREVLEREIARVSEKLPASARTAAPARIGTAGSPTPSAVPPKTGVDAEDEASGAAYGCACCECDA